jgi:hypothetical protein
MLRKRHDSFRLANVISSTALSSFFGGSSQSTNDFGSVAGEIDIAAFYRVKLDHRIPRKEIWPEQTLVLINCL